jgi:hypothetical protein
MTRQMQWASDHCRCKGCDGFTKGTCEECVISQKELLEAENQRAAGCDALPPEFDCWMDVRTRASGFPMFDAGVRSKLPPPLSSASSRQSVI